MKSLSLKGLAAVAALLLVPLLAVPAQSADFTADDTAGVAPHIVNFTPVLGATPDSVIWIFTNNDGSYADTVRDLAAPFTLSYEFDTPDILGYDAEMHAWFAAVDSAVIKWAPVPGGANLIFINPPPMKWGEQLDADYVNHPRMISHCDEHGVDSAMGKWHFEAYPNHGKVLAFTFAVRNTGILDNLDSVVVVSQCEVGYAVDYVYLYRDDGDSLWLAADEPIDSVQLDTTAVPAFIDGDTVSIWGFFAELPRNDTTYFHIVVRINSDSIRAKPGDFPDSTGIGVKIPLGGLSTELETDGQSPDIENICYSMYQAGSPGVPKAAGYNILLHYPDWGPEEELHAWYVSHYWITDSSYCDQSGVDSAYMKWHFDAFPYDDQVPLRCRGPGRRIAPGECAGNLRLHRHVGDELL